MTLDASGTIIGYYDYYPFGSIMPERSMVSTLSGKYRFTGKERDSETSYDYFGARYYDSKFARWLSVDPLADKYPGWSPYVYVKNNPLVNFDPNGKWDVKVHVAKNRSENPMGTAIVTDRSGKEVFRLKVRVTGVGGRDRLKKNSDTPLGTYDIPDKGMWKTGGSRASYGPNPRLILNGIDGEIKESGRTDIRIHGGRQETQDKNGNWITNPNAELKSTHGCIRAFDDDISTMKEITDGLENNDPKEHGGRLEVTDEPEDKDEEKEN